MPIKDHVGNISMTVGTYPIEITPHVVNQSHSEIVIVLLLPTVAAAVIVA